MTAMAFSDTCSARKRLADRSRAAGHRAKDRARRRSAEADAARHRNHGHGVAREEERGTRHAVSCSLEFSAVDQSATPATERRPGRIAGRIASVADGNSNRLRRVMALACSERLFDADRDGSAMDDIFETGSQTTPLGSGLKTCRDLSMRSYCGAPGFNPPRVFFLVPETPAQLARPFPG